MIGRRIAVAVSATWFNHGVRIALNLMLLPVLYRCLGNEELAVWLVLSQSSVLVTMIMDASITPTITRRIAFARGRSRTSLDEPLDESSRAEMADLMATSGMIYRGLAMVLLVLGMGGGAIYLANLDLSQVPLTTALIAWGLFCVGHVVGLWASLWTALANGLGYIATATMIATGLGTLTLVVQIGVALAGGGLIWLAAVPMVSGIATQLAIRAFVRRRQRALINAPGRWNRAVASSLAPPAARAWLTALGMALLFRTDQHFIALYVAPAEVPPYYAVYTLLHNLAVLSMALGKVSHIYVSQLWRSGDLAQIHDIVLRSLRIALILTGCGIAVLLVVARDIISLWLGLETFVGMPVLAVLCLLMFLAVQQNAVLGFSRATENEVYAAPFLIAGAVNLALSWVLVQRYGVLGAALGPLIAQLAVTHWLVLRSAFHRLRLPWRQYVVGCAVPVSALFLATWTAARMVAGSDLLPQTEIHRVGAVLVVSGTACMAGLWAFGLDTATRAAVRDRLGAGMRRLIVRP